MSGFLCAGPVSYLTGVNWSCVLGKDTFSFGLQVLELAPVNGPAEDRDDQQHEAGRKRNQDVQAFHAGLYRAARSALSTTTSELPAMPSPAAQGGSQPTSARGMLVAL